MCHTWCGGVKKEHKDIIEGTDYGLLDDKIKSQDHDADNAFYADDDRGWLAGFEKLCMTLAKLQKMRVMRSAEYVCGHGRTPPVGL